ncbi:MULTISPECIES: diacylglycerol/lipid kinase family protein [unclassified Nocardioides]|uniref:diacylglycerol/lipid kinase family protein n=1 Tax=unclassified Nocardioides TaxID=2615069 RepID=UPI000B008F5C|nr:MULTISPECIES: YegS/Rv2252/BmrU family lipid kinase [unclassified Nocardioides]
MTDSIVVITNADAGTADDEALETALGVLRGATTVEVHATSSPDELDTVLDGLGDLGDRRLVVVGGDGSIHAVVAALHRRNELTGRVLGLVPLGTGNDFARTLGIPLDPEEAAELVLAGATRAVDLVVDERDAVTVNGVHLGAGAEAGEKGARWKSRLGSVGIGKVNLGRIGYPIGALQTALNPPTLRVRVEVDGEVVVDVDHQVLMVALGNGASVGGGTELTPDAHPFDGLVDVLIATPVGTLSRLGYALRLPFGRHEEHADVQIVRGRTVRVTGCEFTCNSDGEIDGPVRSRSWRVLPSAYAMVVPVSESGNDASGT